MSHPNTDLDKLSTQLKGDFRDRTIFCQNSQKDDVRGSLIHLTRYSAVFEVYSPYSILQLSEVLSPLRLYYGNRLVYNGSATVTTIVNTGILLVCEVQLRDHWIDVDLVISKRENISLREQFEDFIEEWGRVHMVHNDFKLVVADLQTLFVGLRRWLEQVEIGLRTIGDSGREELEKDVFEQLGDSVVSQSLPFLTKFEEATRKIEAREQSIHKSYVRRQIHPIVLCAPFVYRTFHKPLGYAGDYEMVNMMLRDPYEGRSLFSKVLNHVFLETPPVKAHRNRIRYLSGVLREEVARVGEAGRRAAIFDLGCGPAQEIQDFLASGPLADNADFTLLDFNDETIQFAEKTLRETKERHGRRTKVEIVRRSVHQILKDASRQGSALSRQRYDVVYCAGLFDYLSDRVCKKLMDVFYETLLPGGLLVVTNVSRNNPSRQWMEYVVEWNLVYRDNDGMARLVPRAYRGPKPEVKRDATGVNLFMELRKPETGLKLRKPESG